MRYLNLSEAEYEKILSGFLPAVFAPLIADAEAHAAQGWLGRQLSHTEPLIGTAHDFPRGGC